MSYGQNFQKFGVITAMLLATLAHAPAAEPKVRFSIPDYTRSPNGQYGVTVPIFDVVEDNKIEPTNNLVEIRTGRVLAVIQAKAGYDRPLNHHEALPSRWSPDGSLLLWEVAGKWFPDALVLLRLENGRMAWQRNLLRLAQQAILMRTRKAAPEKYAVAKKTNAGNGSAYPDGFTIDVEALDPISLPLRVRAVLTSHPKAAEGVTKLESHLEAVVDKKGKFKVTDFGLGYVESRHF